MLFGNEVKVLPVSRAFELNFYQHCVLGPPRAHSVPVMWNFLLGGGEAKGQVEGRLQPQVPKGRPVHGSGQAAKALGHSRPLPASTGC